MKAMIPPISALLMPFLILGGGILIAAAFFAAGARFIFVWPTLMFVGIGILSVNRSVVSRRLKRLEEKHHDERVKWQEANRPTRT